MAATERGGDRERRRPSAAAAEHGGDQGDVLLSFTNGRTVPSLFSSLGSVSDIKGTGLVSAQIGESKY